MSKYNYFVEVYGTMYPLVEVTKRDTIEHQYADTKGKMTSYEYKDGEGVIRLVSWPQTIIAIPEGELPKPQHVCDNSCEPKETKEEE